MDESEFDLELKKFYSEERKKERFRVVSAEKERSAVLDAFFDHYRSSIELMGGMTVEDFLEEVNESAVDERNEFSQDDDEAVDELCSYLDMLSQQDIERYDTLLSGEMNVSGEGMFMFIPDTGDDSRIGGDVGIIEEGMEIIGDIKQYKVAPVFPQEALAQMEGGESSSPADEVDVTGLNVPGIWLQLENATLFDEMGGVVDTYEELMLPFGYTTLKFHKIIRQSDELAPAVKGESVRAPASTHFKGDFILEIYNDVENDLNHNHHEGEEAHAIRAEYQLELNKYMNGVDREAFLQLDASSAAMLDGSQRELSSARVRYIEPVIASANGSWRVIHAFEVYDSDNSIKIAHILPEDITSIDSKVEE